MGLEVVVELVLDNRTATATVQGTCWRIRKAQHTEDARRKPHNHRIQIQIQTKALQHSTALRATFFRPRVPPAAGDCGLAFNHARRLLSYIARTCRAPYGSPGESYESSAGGGAAARRRGID